MDTKEIFKREMVKAGFDPEVYRGLPAVRVQSAEEVEDVLRIASMECEQKNCHQFYLVFPKIKV